MGPSPSPKAYSKRPKANGNENNNSSAKKKNRRALFAELSTNTYKTNQVVTSIKNYYKRPGHKHGAPYATTSALFSAATKAP